MAVPNSIAAAGVDTFLLSRFNVYHPEFRDRVGLTDENYEAWCRTRTELFRRYTLPSVLNQRMRGVKWLIWFDTEVNDPIAGLIEELEAHRDITPVLYDNRPHEGGIGFAAHVQQELTKHFSTGHEFLATTRLDTDDVLHRDFVGSLGRPLNKADASTDEASLFACNVPFGAQLTEDGRVFAYMYDNNPFISVVERKPSGDGGRPLTALGMRHFEAATRMPVKQIIHPEPLWLQVLHGGNVANVPKQGTPELVISPSLREAFGLDERRAPRWPRPLRSFRTRVAALGAARKVSARPSQR